MGTSGNQWKPTAQYGWFGRSERRGVMETSGNQWKPTAQYGWFGRSERRGLMGTNGKSMCHRGLCVHQWEGQHGQHSHSRVMYDVTSNSSFSPASAARKFTWHIRLSIHPSSQPAIPPMNGQSHVNSRHSVPSNNPHQLPTNTTHQLPSNTPQFCAVHTLCSYHPLLPSSYEHAPRLRAHQMTFIHDVIQDLIHDVIRHP